MASRRLPRRPVARPPPSTRVLPGESPVAGGFIEPHGAACDPTAIPPVPASTGPGAPNVRLAPAFAARCSMTTCPGSAHASFRKPALTIWTALTVLTLIGGQESEGPTGGGPAGRAVRRRHGGERRGASGRPNGGVSRSPTDGLGHPGDRHRRHAGPGADFQQLRCRRSDDLQLCSCRGDGTGRTAAS